MVICRDCIPANVQMPKWIDRRAQYITIETDEQMLQLSGFLQKCGQRDDNNTHPKKRKLQLHCRQVAPLPTSAQVRVCEVLTNTSKDCASQLAQRGVKPLRGLIAYKTSTCSSWLPVHPLRAEQSKTPLCGLVEGRTVYVAQNSITDVDDSGTVPSKLFSVTLRRW